MKKYISIFIGGAAGAILRYAMENVQLFSFNNIFPYNTLLINLSGSFFLTFLMTVFFEAWEIPAQIRLGIAVGFLGGYTTFSTFCKETAKLFLCGEWLLSLIYILITVIFGLGLSFLGIFLARRIIKTILERKHENRIYKDETGPN
jgi:fluoride exporter